MSEEHDGAPAYRQAGTLRAGPPDYLLLVSAAALLIVGLLTVYTTSFAVGYYQYGDTNYFVARQAVFSLLGVGAMVFFMRLDYARLRSLSVPMLAIAVVGLCLVLLPGIGTNVNGSSRWLLLGPISIQPSEFAKFAVIIYISAWLASRGKDISQFSLGFAPFVMILGIIGGLVIAEPDMGTTVVILLAACTLFFVAGAPLSHLALLLGVGGAIAYAVISTREYQLDRLVSFTDPHSDPQGVGFQILQLLIALGSGGPLGIGWAESRQKFFYVPGAHTDGVIAILGEEIGFVGLMFVFSIFAVFIWRALVVTLRSPDKFAMLMGMGIVAWIAGQTLINVAGITRTIPLTGVPLPFLSYGGSSLIMLMAAVGVLLSISRYSNQSSYLERERARPTATARKATGRRGYDPKREPV